MKINCKRAIAVLGLVATALTSAPAHAQDKEISIGALIYARDSQFWQQVERGMADAAKEYGVSLNVGLNRRQLATEAQVVEDFATRGVDAIILPPLDTQASVAAVKRAAERGIVVVDYDTRLADPDVASHTIGVDSFDLAATVAGKMREELDAAGGGKIALITLPPTNPNMQTRLKGAMSKLEGEGIEVVNEIAAATPEQGATALEMILQRTPDVAAVWASNSGSLSGAAAAARCTESDVKLFGVDMSQELAEAMLDPDGNVHAVSDQQPYRIGFAAVETAAKSVRGENPPREVKVDVRLYSRDDPQGVQSYLDLVKSLAQ
ncbi:sugar ABC transporter substrate-binding protein [Chelativorans sp. AA-79]|uniref:sugar ABC transporter substrate-binding protein n=1 Tax=Chelativorans sp. AA-79 TaxID=3028735 RepID=UPI0023F6A1B6|nr:sugar ABC transporter substrate-binding protein [Chelativorans sp. AA-79]WEX07259.1 sugar ABC transporter substrate-binding protein [Chelativorans sp. AA-79]